jgi:hypothetical protein
VAAAYGWPADLADEEMLARLFEPNQARAGRAGAAARRGGVGGDPGRFERASDGARGVNQILTMAC